MHILGASGHAKVIVDILNLNKEQVSGIWDDNLMLTDFLGYPVMGTIASFCAGASAADTCIVAVGNNEVRMQIASNVHAGFGSALHPTSCLSPSVILGSGIVVMAHVSVNCFTKIGDHVIINTNASVDHECVLGDYVHVSPQAGLAGNVKVGAGTHIGIGACVIQGIKIGKWATIGAGAVVIKDVPDYAVVVGNPARIIKYKNR